MRESWATTHPNTKLFIILLLIVVAFLLAVLAWVVRNWRGDPVVAAGTGSAAQSSSPVSLRPIIREQESVSGVVAPISVAERAVLERHFAALGGVQKIASISSIRFTGQVIFPDGQSQDVVVVKKAGERIRITSKGRSVQATLAVTPDDAWYAIWRAGQLAEVRDLDPASERNQRRHIYVVSELYLAMQNSWQIRYLGEKDFNYKMAHVFEVQMDPRNSIRFFIDPESFLDVGREDREFAEDGTLTITRRLQSGHFESNGLRFPGTVDAYEDGELIQTFKVESAELNPGVLDSGFERPVMPPTP